MLLSPLTRPHRVPSRSYRRSNNRWSVEGVPKEVMRWDGLCGDGDDSGVHTLNDVLDRTRLGDEVLVLMMGP